MSKTAKKEKKEQTKKKKNRHGDGCLVLRGKKYYARWMVDGKVYTRATGTGEKREAEKKLEEFVAPFKLGDKKSTLEGLAAKVKGVEAEIQAYEDSQPALALADGFEAYRKSTERPDSGERTMEGYESQYGRLVTWMSKHYPDATEMRHVSRDMAEAFMADLAASNSANTYNKYVTLFKRVWDILAETARLTLNPWAKIQHKVEEQATRRELTTDELRRVIESVSGEGEMRVLFAVGIYTGLRLGDCALLDWGHVDLIRRKISLIPRKTKRHAKGKPVKIKIHRMLAPILEEIPSNMRRGYVLPGIAATYLKDDSILSRRITAIFRGCGIETSHKADGDTRATVDVGFHSLRHTFVSLCANEGVPLAIVQAMVGHSNPSMTEHYLHPSDKALDEAIAALPSIGDSEQQMPTAALPKAALALLDKLDRAKLLALQAEIARRL